MKKKLWLVLLALVSALCLCLGLAACGEKPAKPTKPSEGSETKHTFTADNVCSDCGEKWAYTDGLEYELDGDAYTVTGIGTASGDIVIPYGHEGKFVTKIADEAFKGSEAITGIYIPEKIVSVGRVAFAECPNLISATWDAADCTKAGVTMDEMVNGDDYTYADVLIFYESGLKTITIGEHAKKIPDGAFTMCNGITNLSIPKGVTFIGIQAFSDCEALQTVQWNAENCSTAVLPENVELHVDPFAYCENLQAVVFGDSVRTIPANLFYECDSLESVTIGKNVTKIGEDAFYSCGGINAVHITDLAAWCRIEFANEDASPTGYGDCLLYLGEEEIKELIIPSEITEIKNYAFMNFYELTSVVIPDSVTSIGAWAFAYCDGLTSITIPDGVTSIEDYTFIWCEGLTSVTIPDGVTKIGDYAFYYCSGLTSITIPDGVTKIGKRAFLACSGLTDIQFKDTVQEWQGISKSNDWDWDTGDYTITCTDGKIAKDGTVTMN